MDKLVACGDSWCWGAELVDPAVEPVPIMNLPGGGFERQSKPENVAYRLKHRYINVLAEHAGITDVEDLSIPSLSNDAILRRLIQWLFANGYNSRNTENLFVSIGWTSPERTEHYYKERWGDDNYAPYGPWSLEQQFENKDLHTFYNLYFDLFGSPQGFVNKYIQTVYLTEMLLKSMNIKYIMHQAFYHHHEQMIKDWKDNDYKKDNMDLDTSYSAIWDSIDARYFVNKNHPELSTAHHVMVHKGGIDNVFEVFHPNANGHKIWGDYLYDFCVVNGTLA